MPFVTGYTMVYNECIAKG